MPKLEDIGLAALAELDATSVGVGVVIGGLTTAIATYLLVVRPLRAELEESESARALERQHATSWRVPSTPPMTVPSRTLSYPPLAEPPSTRVSERAQPTNRLRTLQSYEPPSGPRTTRDEPRSHVRAITFAPYTMRTGT